MLVEAKGDEKRVLVLENGGEHSSSSSNIHWLRFLCKKYLKKLKLWEKNHYFSTNTFFYLIDVDQTALFCKFIDMKGYIWFSHAKFKILNSRIVCLLIFKVNQDSGAFVVTLTQNHWINILFNIIKIFKLINKI